MKNSKKSYYKKLFDFLDKFFNDDTTYYAASLSFFTIFAILPIIAIIIAIISQLKEFDKYVDDFIIQMVNLINPSQADEFISLFYSFIENSDKLGGIGIVYVLFVFTMFFKDYEYIVNKIHKTKRKSIAASFIFYLVFITFLPVLFVLYIYLTTVYNNSIFDVILTAISSWAVFIVLFKYTVNKVISLKAVLVSSFLTLVSLLITKNLFVYYVLYNQTYSTLYGSLATLLFSFFWIYVSWIIFLYGIKLCHRLNIQYKN